MDERRITAVLHGWGVAAVSTEDGAGQRLRHLPSWEFARNLATALAGPGGDGASVDALMAQRAAHWGRFFDAQHGLDDEDRIVYERFRALAAAGATGEEGSERWS